jgi:anti-sigma B factor antagonist
MGTLSGRPMGTVPRSRSGGDEPRRLEIGVAGGDGSGGAAKSEGVERLEQPALNTRAAGHRHVGGTVEQQQDRHLGHLAGIEALLQVESCGNAAHVADLQVEDHESGIDLAHGRPDVAPGADADDRGVIVGERGVDVFEDPVRVGRQEHVGHDWAGYESGKVRCQRLWPGVNHVGSVARQTAATIADRVPEEEHVLDIQVDEADSYTVCRPVGELDAYTVGQFRDALGELADKRYLLIDLSSVPFMDSAGLGALIGGIRRAREAGGDVAVACSRPTLTRLLHTTGFDRIVPVKETVESAAAALDEAAASVDE